jgi:predicted dinucleotide-binding enzyme
MKFGVLGTGMVGEALGGRLAGLGHQVMMGARAKTNDKAAAWAAKTGVGASHGTFADAATFGDTILLAALGSAALDVVLAAGIANLAGKVLIDVTNPLDFSRGMPPGLIPAYSNGTSLAEAIQKAAPHARVVKALNTMNCQVMVNPALLPGEHDVFVSGDDLAAKADVVALLKTFGWKAPIDLGPLMTARGTEAMMLVWLSLWGALGTADFNYRIVRR